ncbi:AAA family ATPase [Micromonospora sp. NBC_00860]|uniref:helix-turn-helix transcriptional regulator n=1 Tax=Micromonospora sp. NBC_00860 TaxID=2975980 RepID=UPI00386BA422|nr:AAA family ATPase [Micromonospora sp. NBC_00860]
MGFAVTVTPAFVGREAELAELRQAAEAAARGTPQALLVRGEAGVGKTRLVDELLRTLDDKRAVVAVGRCIEVGGDAFPFAPFTAALHVLWQRLPDEVQEASAGQEALLAGILPDLDAGASVEHRSEDVGRLLELTTRVLERLASSRLVALVIEDLHWADASTRNLLGYLCRSRRTGRLLLIGTYRSDEVHRRHPLRPLLAELDRLRSVRRVELTRFSRVEVTKQLGGLFGALPDPVVLNDIFARSDGNAFFVEELARAYVEHPGEELHNLREVLLARLEALPDTSQRIARIAAESGAAIGYPLLKAVTGLPEDELIEGLRAAVLAQILVPEPNGSDYRFRHSLVREAVSDSLLPGERALINRRYGEALEAAPSLVRPDELTGRLAQHWYAAHDDAKALYMCVRGADEAWTRYAYAERLSLLERALELWDRVPDEVRGTLPALGLPERYPRRGHGAGEVGPGLLDLLAAATTAGWHSGNLDRSLHLARTALELLASEHEPDPVRAAWFWMRCSQLVQALNRGDGWRELQTAQELVAELPPSMLHADILGHIATWGARHRPGPQSRAAADLAVTYAAGCGAEDLELRTRITLCWLDAATDIDGTSLADLYEVRDRAEKLGVVDLIGRVNQNLPSILEGMGRSEEAIRTADHGIKMCRSLSLADAEAWVHCNRSVSLFSLGRWPESETALDEAAAVAQSDKPRAAIVGRRAYGQLLRGHTTEAADQLTLARELFGTEDLQPQFLIPLVQYIVETATRQGDIAGARAEFLRIAAALANGPVSDVLPALCAAAAIEADALSAGTGSAEVLAAVREAAEHLEIVFPISHAFARVLQAQLSRAEGGDDPGRWAAAVAAFEPLERPYELAGALFGEGRALLAAHRRDAAADRLTAAHRIATGLGAQLLLADIEVLAARAGIAAAFVADSRPVDEQDAEHDAAVSLGLTPRETEVLRLVAQGYSNRRIAEELFITQKTTSTHVSSILAKLGASSRTEAAAIAHRAGLAGVE